MDSCPRETHSYRISLFSLVVYVYSVIFTRREFEGVGHTKMPPYDFCMGFENRINATSTMLLKEIKPFDMEI